MPMQSHRITREISALADTPGVRGCALVEVESGLVLHSAGSRQRADPIWEAARDYWRLHQRLQVHFAELGELGAAAMYHHLGMLVLLPGSEEGDLLMVCIADHGAVDWRHWQHRVRELKGQLRNGA